MSENSDLGETVENADSEEATIMVADPEDYQKSKKLKAIYESKKKVREVLHNKWQIKEEVGRNHHKHWRATLSDALVMYGLELMPVIERAMREGVIQEEDLDAGPMEQDIQTFVDVGGAVRDEDTGDMRPPLQWEAINYYQQLQRIEQKLGLGLDLEEEQTPAEI